MESKWRQNLVQFGLTNSDVNLCARILTGLYAGKYATDWLQQTGYFEVMEAVSERELKNFATVAKRAGHPNFPYGYDVEPDQPL